MKDVIRIQAILDAGDAQGIPGGSMKQFRLPSVSRVVLLVVGVTLIVIGVANTTSFGFLIILGAVALFFVVLKFLEKRL